MSHRRLRLAIEPLMIPCLQAQSRWMKRISRYRRSYNAHHHVERHDGRYLLLPDAQERCHAGNTQRTTQPPRTPDAHTALDTMMTMPATAQQMGQNA